MTIKAKQLFILVGNDKTGKTTIQRLLIEKLCGYTYDRLPTNLRFEIIHPEIKRKYQDASFGNRSYQEKMADYGTVDEYFSGHFSPADICFISSHLDVKDITEMTRNGKERFYNVNGIFFSNSISSGSRQNASISRLDWNERFVIENSWPDNESVINRQLNAIADSIVFFIANRTTIS